MCVDAYRAAFDDGRLQSYDDAVTERDGGWAALMVWPTSLK